MWHNLDTFQLYLFLKFSLVVIQLSHLLINNTVNMRQMYLIFISIVGDMSSLHHLATNIIKVLCSDKLSCSDGCKSTYHVKFLSLDHDEFYKRLLQYWI